MFRVLCLIKLELITMHFKLAYLKLTAFYVLIAMVISIGFSIAIYNISSNELEQGLGRQTRILGDFPPRNNNPIINELEKIRSEQLEKSNSNLEVNLIYYNLLILILSSVVGYFFARRTLEPIEEAMESQSRFAADASHELKTPLTAMRTEIEVNLRDQKLSISDAKRLLKSNLEEIAKLENLSNTLLKLAKLEKESKDDFKVLSLTEIVTEAYEKVESLAKQKSINFDNNFQKLEILGDRSSLIELFVILFDNAIKYSPKKSKIKIEISKVHKYAEVRVNDRGEGIKASDLPYIFNRFYRADNSRSKNSPASGYDGYGLGLSIAKQIVDLHGGSISVSSTPGKGSQFIVKLHIAG